jgi:hypothetical protein
MSDGIRDAEGKRPVRIQRKRTRGWRMPQNAVSVTRPGRFGNPYPVARFGLDLSLDLFRNTARGFWDASILPSDCCLTDEAYKLHLEWLRRIGGHPVEMIHGELRGKDLACWCPIGQPCHADVLLEIANA